MNKLRQKIRCEIILIEARLALGEPPIKHHQDTGRLDALHDVLNWMTEDSSWSEKK